MNWAVAKVEEIDYDDSHPDGVANVFLQWKGTSVCFDFWCECGEDGHFDGYFAYSIKCRKCGLVFKMPSTIYPLKVAAVDGEPVVPTGDDV